MNKEQPITVVGINGSLRPGSHTEKVVNIALQGAKENGVSIQLINLKNLDIPFCDGHVDESNYPNDVFRMREIVKNALDLMSNKEFAHKTVGLVGVAGGAQGAVHSLDQLRTICRSIHAWVTPHQASIAFAGNAFDETGKLKDSALEKRVVQVGNQVATYARLHQQVG